MNEQKYNLPEMSLRDFFAGCALGDTAALRASWETIAEEAYALADAMLDAREEKGEE